MSEKLCLKWDDFQENIIVAFGSFRKGNEFADVTLACEDGQQIRAHKVILAASSPPFQDLLKRNKHPHPLIYMRGIKSENLLSIVDLLYCGEANVFQENLDSFLAVAEELKLRGFMGQSENIEKETENIFSNPAPSSKPAPRQITNLKSWKSNMYAEKLNFDSKINEQKPNAQMNNERRIAIPSFVSGELKELGEKVKSMMEGSENLAPDGLSKAKICKVCGKEGAGIAIRDHIEANHLEGVSLPCNVCGKEFRSRMILRKHKCAI